MSLVARVAKHSSAAIRVLAALLLIGAAAGVRAESIDALLQRSTAAYGGQGPITALRESGRTESLMRGSGPVERAYRRPDRFRIEIRYPEQTEVRVLAGTSAWQQGQPAQPSFRAAMMLQAARLALPWILLERRSQLVDGGTVTLGEQTLRVLELPLADDLRLTAEIDPANGRILRSRGRYTAGGQVMEFSTVYADFAPHAGRLFAHTEEHYAMGRYIGRTRLERVEVLDALPDSLFEPKAP